MKRMLIVDDSELNQEILDLIFEQLYEIKQVESGEDALEAMSTFSPDVVLLDIMMSGIDGYETCTRIRSNPDYASVIIIMVTACELESERDRVIEVGANGYVNKPFNHNEIIKMVHDMLAEV